MNGLKALRKFLKLNQEALAKELGVTRVAISQWESGATTPKFEHIVTMSQYFKLSIETITFLVENFVTESDIVRDSSGQVLVLLNGKGISETKYQDLEIVNRNKASRKLPILNKVQAGNWCGMYDDFAPGDADAWHDTTKKVSKHAFALRVSGDSMTSEHGLSIAEGSIVIVDPEVEPQNGKIVVARLETQTAAIMKKLVIDGPNMYLMSLNSKYDNIPIDENTTIVGVVVRVELDI